MNPTTDHISSHHGVQAKGSHNEHRPAIDEIKGSSSPRLYRATHLDSNCFTGSRETMVAAPCIATNPAHCSSHMALDTNNVHRQTKIASRRLKRKKMKMKPGSIFIALMILLTAGLFSPRAHGAPIFVPGQGEVKLKLTDASNFYSSGGAVSPRTDLFPDGMTDAYFDNDYEAILNTELVGSRNFTAFDVETISVDGSESAFAPGGVKLTGILTFMEVEMAVTTVSPISGRQILMALGDDESRPHQLAGSGTDPVSGNPTVGRFFLFQNDDSNAGDFAQTNGMANDGIGGTPSDVNFSSFLGDNVVDGFEIDLINNFTGGTLVATGSIVGQTNSAIPGGFIVDVLSESANAGVSWAGIIHDSDLLIDGGEWFEKGILDRATFQINQYGYDGTPGVTPLEGDPSVFAGGWQVSSEDPISFKAVPEPSTMILLMSMGSYLMWRRNRQPRRIYRQSTEFQSH